MKLEIVNFEQAKALKELGFPQLEECAWYSTYLGQISIINYDMKYPEICAPTLELVAKWLREEKDIEVYCVPYIDETNEKFYYYEIVGYDTNKIPYMDYDSALSAGIDNVLKIISL